MTNLLILQNQSNAQRQTLTEILELLKNALGKNFKPELIELSYPPNDSLGDITLSCFLLAKELKKSPQNIAAELAQKIKPQNLIKAIKAEGPYFNFFLNPEKLSELTLKQIAKEKEKFGQAKLGENQKIILEFFSPNTNKPLTIGHIRNLCLGESLTNLLKLLGYKTITETLYNDRGIALAKAILAYQKWGQNQTPKSAGLKPDHFVGNFYVRFGKKLTTNPSLEKEAQKVLAAWETGEKQIIKIWKKLREWVLEGFQETLKNLGIEKFDKEYYESDFYKLGKELVLNGFKKGIFKKDNGSAIYAPLQNYGLADKVLLRADGTSLYITQDIYLAYLKNKEKPQKSIYVVGSEQELYFKQLFKILELLGFGSIKNYHHLSYGMVRLAEGRIKSREGLVKGTIADELLAELQKLAEKEILARHKNLKSMEIEKRGQAIALAALKFYILQVEPKTGMVFEPEKSIQFFGKTGPYLLYVYARIASILRKEKAKVSAKVDFSKLGEPEAIKLVKLLAQFPQMTELAAKNFDPSELAKYLYELAQSFSLFYEKLPVLKAKPETKNGRLLLIGCVQLVLKRGLELLGIKTLEEM